VSGGFDYKLEPAIAGLRSAALPAAADEQVESSMMHCYTINGHQPAKDPAPGGHAQGAKPLHITGE
jgi:hypothetical protein